MKRNEYEFTEGQEAGLYPFLFLVFLIGLLLGGLVERAKAQECKTLNTTVHFAETPKDAQYLAKRDGKMVMLLHVSGNFAKEGFT